MLRGNRTIGIVREVYTKWERRAPLCPSHVKKLVDGGLRVLIQPSKKRVFNDAEYAAAGAEMREELAEASVILGVKQVPPEHLLSDRTYVFFSHVIKAQAENMPLLDTLLEKNIRLIDYECITEQGLRTAPRLIAFGGYAGRAGMVNTMRGLGERMLSMGFSTPFLNVASSYMYLDLPHARAAVQAVGEQIAQQGLPQELSPFTVVFTGSGNVSSGAQEIFKLLPHKFVTPAQLAALKESGEHSNKLVYGCVVNADSMVRARDGSAFSKEEYYTDPSKYEPCFHETILPHTTAIMNCTYWDPRFPRLITTDQLAALRESGNEQLIGVGDVTCDVGGNIEFFSKSTQVENPCYMYDVRARQESDSLDGDGVMMMGVDILPSELPRESSKHFGDHLMPFIPALAESNGELSFEQQGQQLPPELHGAIITAHGEVTPAFSYIQSMRQQRDRQAQNKAAQLTALTAGSTVLLLQGHLFDSGLINKSLDIIEDEGGNFYMLHMDVRPNSDDSFKSRCWVQMSVDGGRTRLDEVISRIKALAAVFPAADATVQEEASGFCGGDFSLTLGGESNSRGDYSTTANVFRGGTFHAPVADLTSSDPASSAPVKAERLGGGEAQKVLLLGAGLVAAPAVEYLTRPGHGHRVTVASGLKAEAVGLLQRGAESWGHAGERDVRAIQLDVTKDGVELQEQVRDADIVLSLLPAALHHPVAEACLEHGTALVTASYVDDRMQSLHDSAIAAGVPILCEMGLDPGMDHMSAMAVIDEVKAEGGEITSFSSLCGGLPAPEAADNPLAYKFSWSPRGVLSAAKNSASYLELGEECHVAAEDLLASARPVNIIPSLSLEHLPNRDSLPYGEIYGIEGASTVYRGTLRYGGWAAVMHDLAQLGFMEDTGASEAEPATTWSAFAASKGVTSASSGPGAEFLGWLGVFDDSCGGAGVQPLELGGRHASVLDALCELLQDKLAYAHGERDMCLMHHEFGVKTSDGVEQTRTSTLLLYGDAYPDGDSSMAKTVGITAAIGVELIARGALDKDGVLVPTTPDVYEPALELLDLEGIRWTERTQTVSS